jgi:glycosyltransferase involved in cell wall biosynthesis
MAITLRQKARFKQLVGDFDPAMEAPRIAPVPADAVRPLWSVMIPTYNCAAFLRQTLESVLAQDPGPERMQIEVVDDVSTRDNPEAVVREVGRGRVAFFRKERNGGAIPNFNTCIERSRGHLVHILHGDDFVAPGFHASVQAAAEAHPDIAAFFMRCRVIDDDGTLDSIGQRMRALAKPTHDVRELHHLNNLFTPGVVVRRAFYEQRGGFLPPLVHCADWEMWVRAISRGGGLWINELLASYRFFAANDTNRLVRSAENIRDRLRLAAIFAQRFPDFDYALCERTLARQALRQMQKFEALGDRDAVAANRRAYELLAPPSRRRLLAAWDREIGIVRKRP